MKGSCWQSYTAWFRPVAELKLNGVAGSHSRPWDVAAGDNTRLLRPKADQSAASRLKQCGDAAHPTQLSLRTISRRTLVDRHGGIDQA